jgi:hypothetical protein
MLAIDEVEEPDASKEDPGGQQELVVTVDSFVWACRAAESTEESGSQSQLRIHLLS